MTLGMFKKCYLQNVFRNHIFDICMYKKILALKNLKWLIFHEMKPKNLNNQYL